MGRSFATELEKLTSTYEFACQYDILSIEKISSFLCKSYNTPLFLIGSGGSYTVAKAFELLHNRSGLSGIAKAVTPLEFAMHITSLNNASVVLLTANGNNNDTVNTYKLIQKCNPSQFLTICFNENSKIKKLSEEDSYVFIGQRLPTGKDGYLAVNSILVALVLISRAYNDIFNSNSFHLAESFSSYITSELINAPEVLSKESIIVLHSDFATPVATDIESKFSEAALGNVLLCDYRNFAHGRHFWLSQRAKTTSIIALTTPENKLLCAKTLGLIPSDISILEIDTNVSGVWGMIELFISAFQLVNKAGKLFGIDPGKPSVPDFGKKMYHISYTPPNALTVKKNNQLSTRATLRKCTFLNSDLFEFYRSSFNKFMLDVQTIKFKELIFDYDATLVEKESNLLTEQSIFEYVDKLLASNITIKVATGRGKSVRHELQDKVQKQYWDNVIIGYYNGGIISNLNDNTSPNPDIDVNDALREIALKLQKTFSEADIELRPRQLTIMLDSYEKIIHQDYIMELSRKYNVKAFLSGHSIDIVPLESSKLNLIQNENCLCIGDSGQYQGNDYELLSHKYSLSVNRVSSAADSCWNFAPLELCDTKATLYYLKQLQINDGSFQLIVQ